MSQKNSLSLLVSSIKINLIRNRLKATFPYSKLNCKVLTILYQQGYLRGFRAISSTQICAYLSSSKKANLPDICYFSVNNRNNYISYRKLASQYGLKNFLIISTDIGLLTLEEAFLYKKGGQLLVLIPR